MGLILHIPHCSERFPPGAIETYGVGAERVRREARILGDLLTDQLYASDRFPSVVFPWSRLFVDVERFRDGTEEPMAERGMGALYRVGHDLASLKRDFGRLKPEQLLAEYYDPHHRELRERVEEALSGPGEVLIVDCHSFPVNRLPYEDPDARDRPEICVGTDPFHTSEKLMKGVCSFFLKKGYSVATNRPFAGALVPLPFYRKDHRVQSVMIEIRRDLFLAGDGCSPGTGFGKIAADISLLLGTLAV